MPRSIDEGKAWMREQIVALQPGSILDVGPGWGTYARLLRPHLPDCTFLGVEIYPPYVQRYSLLDWYDEVIIGDIRQVDAPLVDVVILGDVLEHMSFDDAVTVWTQARHTARRAVFLSLPVVDYPQGAWEGNEHEAHLHIWSHDLVMSTLPGIVDHATYTQIGVYQAGVL